MNAAGGDTLEVIDILRLMEYLPHRYPFLMIDRIVGMRGDDFGIGIKNVTFNEPHFMGHFPNYPVMPGVLLIEGMAQTGGALCIAARPELAGQAVYFMTIDKAKFRKPVVPGDVVEHHMTKLRQRGTIWRYQGVSYVAGAIVAEAEVTAMIGVKTGADD